MGTSTFAIRDCLESDFPFIYATWKRGFRFGNQLTSWWDQDDYFDHYNKVTELILNRPDTHIKVACLADDPETVLGYAIFGEPKIIHYVHVKEAFRRFGIANALLPKDITRATFMTPAGWAIFHKKYPDGKFMPLR